MTELAPVSERPWSMIVWYMVLTRKSHLKKKHSLYIYYTHFKIGLIVMIELESSSHTCDTVLLLSLLFSLFTSLL